MFDIRDLTNPIAMKAYNLSNIKIIRHANKNSGYCYIYFSGNGLYQDTEEDFKTVIFKKDRYEWEKRKSSVPECEIFVRDIFKQWYIAGINNKLSTIDAMLEELKIISSGYKIVTVGCSAGGYMAVLAGAFLHAEMVLNFSGQYDLSSRVESNPLLKQFKGGKYCNISEIAKHAPTTIFYFYPIKNKDDYYQASLVADGKNIRAFPIRSTEHGIVVSKETVVKVLNMSLDDLQNVYENVQNYPSISLIKLTYILVGFKGLTRAVVYDIEKRIYRTCKKLAMSVLKSKKK